MVVSFSARGETPERGVRIHGKSKDFLEVETSRKVERFGS